MKGQASRLALAALVAGSTVVAVLLAELVLFSLGHEPRYRWRGDVPDLAPWWQCEEGEDCRYVRRFTSDPEQYNDAGFHDRDPFRAPVDEVRYRILLLGDSFAFGASAYGPGESFAELVETGLDALLWNTGVPGSGQRDQKLRLREFQPLLEPDLVLLAFYMNDFQDNLYPPGQHYVFADGSWIQRYRRRPDGEVEELTPAEAYGRVFRRARSPKQALEISRLGTLILGAARQVRTGMSRGGGGGGGGGDTVPAPPAGEPRDEAFETTADLLREIQQRAEDGGSRFLMLLIPSRADVADGDGVTDRYRHTRELCRQLELDCVEVRDLLTEDDYDRDHPLDSHWTADGHRKVARRLIERIDALRSGP